MIGIPDERLGEIVAAVVKVKPGQDLSEAELLTVSAKDCRATSGPARSSSTTCRATRPERSKNPSCAGNTPAGLRASASEAPAPKEPKTTFGEKAMHKLLTDQPGKEMLLLGNEAIARGALEAGVSFATCYPGTPSSEIPEQFFRISQETEPLFRVLDQRKGRPGSGGRGGGGRRAHHGDHEARGSERGRRSADDPGLRGRQGRAW